MPLTTWFGHLSVTISRSQAHGTGCGVKLLASPWACRWGRGIVSEAGTAFIAPVRGRRIGAILFCAKGLTPVMGRVDTT